MAAAKRKTKRTASTAAAAAAAEDDAETSLDTAALSLSLPDDMPTDALAHLVPDLALEAPTAEGILALYRVVVAQAASLESSGLELEDSRAAVFRKEVELESAIAERETSVKELENALDGVRSELSIVTADRDALQASQSSLQAQMTALNTTQSASSSEVDSLRRRMEDAETEKRNLMAVMDRMKEQDTQRDDEVKTLRDRLKEAREEINDLQSKLSETLASDNANQFKLHTIEQELVLANDEREQLRADLSAKIEERAKYRREKDAQIRELQGRLDASEAEAASTRTSLEALQVTHEAQSRQLQTALAKSGELQGELAAKESAFRAELANTKRMVAMLERRQEEARGRVEEVDREWNDLTNRAAQTEDKLRREIDRERARGDELERQLDELRGVMDRMAAGDLPVPAVGETNGGNGIGNGFALSPTASLASKLQKSGRSYTEVYTDYVRLQDELTRQKHETKRLEDCLAQILADIEERAPLLQEQRVEYERVSAEARQMSQQLAAVLEERDVYAQRAREGEQKERALLQEQELLRQQLQDVGRQVQTLLREQTLRDNPGLALAELDEPAAGSDIDRLVSDQLVLFKSIPELQEQNARLLAITRDLGARMERQEAEQREREEAEDSALLQEAERLVAQAQAEVAEARQSAKVKIDGYTREIDMLKGMLAKVASSPASAALITAEGSAVSSAEFAEAQRNFDAYRLEIGEDNRRLKEDLLAAQREVGAVNAALAKANAKITTLEERVRNGHEEIQSQKRAIAELSRAKDSLQAQLARAETSHAEMLEQHALAAGQAETLRSQVVQLKAEREVLKGVEARLSAENRSLASQRTHLTDLMSSLRKMQKDLEVAEEGDKRRLEGRVQTLESTAEDLRGQLNKERELLRHAQFQKDTETRTLRERVDKATQDLSSTREQLVAAQTSQAHLQERVDDLNKQLQAAQERISVYERRPTTAAGAAPVPGTNDAALTLEAEVAELRAQLKIAEVDLQAAKSHVEQFREISAGSEAALEQVSATYEQYKARTEQELAEKTASIKALEQKLGELQTELGAATSRNTELQKTLEKERAAFAEDKRTLEDTIVEVTNSNSTTLAERESHAAELRQQQERARVAEEQYQREIVAHADDIKSLERAREQLMQAQSSAREFQTQAETAQAKLRTSETSWAAQKEILDKQISELSTKQQELVEQNNLLHQHLETVSSQAARIRQAADASVSEAAESGSDPALAELRTVVSYLRKEKEIADLQIEINQQEIARLKADGERLARDLDEQRALLAEERTRATNSLASAQQQAELVERINQLNILRESNATLRSDAQAQRKRVAHLETQVQALTAELEPLKTEAREAKAELESRLQQISQLEKENTRWKERSQQILSKYDRADPEEVQKLKDEIESLRTVNAELETKSEGYRSNLAAFKGQYESLTTKTRQNFSNLNATIAANKEEINSLTVQRDALQKQLAEAQSASSSSSVAAQEVERLKARIQALVGEKQALEATLTAEKKALEERLSAQQVSAGSDAEVVALRAERDKLLAEKASWSATTGSDDEKAAKIAALEAEKAQISESVAKFKNDAQNMFLQNKRMQDGNKALNAEVAALKAEKTSLEEQLKTAQASSGPSESSAEIEALRAKVAELEQRLAQQPPATSGGADLASIEKALVEAEAKFKADHDVALQTAAENARQESSLKIQAQLGQIKKLNQRVKQLGDELRKHNIDVPKAEPMPPPAPIATTSASPTTATPGTPLAIKTQVPATPGPSTSTPNAAGQAAMALPNRKPSLPAPPLSAGLPPTPPANHAAGRGRGAPRGGRGRGGGIRGGGPPGAAAVVAAASAAAAGSAPGPSNGPVTGTKRPREEGEQIADSLTKRLRGGGPVPIQRNRPLPQT